jgi:lysophospholipase L1-like esterase
MRRLFKWLVLAGALGAGVIGRRALARLRATMESPANSPRAFLRDGRPDRAHTAVVCAGDSLTHGVASANYVELLERRFAPDGYAFVNAGINGNLAYNVLQRLDAIIACRPDVVTLLIGTNDVNATFNDVWAANYRREQRLPETPTLDWSRRNLAQVIDRLQAETTARIALLSLPMLGEDLASDMNERIRAFNAFLRTLAAAKGVAYLPLHEALLAALPANHAPPPYQGKRSAMLRALFAHHVLRKPWAAISAHNGLALLTDHVHLNDQGAAIIARLIGEFLAGDPADRSGRGGQIG